MNVTRTVFGRHRNGYVFPMLLCVKPMASSFTGSFRYYTRICHDWLYFALFATVRMVLQGSDSFRLLGMCLHLWHWQVSCRSS